MGCGGLFHLLKVDEIGPFSIDGNVELQFVHGPILVVDLLVLFVVGLPLSLVPGPNKYRTVTSAGGKVVAPLGCFLLDLFRFLRFSAATVSSTERPGTFGTSFGGVEGAGNPACGSHIWDSGICQGS